MFEERRRRVWKVSWSPAQPLPVNIPCSDNWKYHRLRIVATCRSCLNRNANDNKIMAATPSSLSWRVSNWWIHFQRFTQAKMSREEILADFQVLLATNENISYQQLWEHHQSFPKYISLHLCCCVCTILCLLSYFVKLGCCHQCAAKKYTNDERAIYFTGMHWNWGFWHRSSSSGGG